jgi:hypothetical protein
LFVERVAARRKWSTRCAATYQSGKANPFQKPATDEMPNESILALPWPAWHTKAYNGRDKTTENATAWLWYLTDRELVAVHHQHGAFSSAHRYGEGRHWWKITGAEHEASRDVERSIQYVMASRFKEIVEKSDQALAIGRAVRQGRAEARKKLERLAA